MTIAHKHISHPSILKDNPSQVCGQSISIGFTTLIGVFEVDSKLIFVMILKSK
jgi:hypothetical protein